MKSVSVAEEIRPWAKLWRREGLEARVTVEFSARLTRSLGRCHPDTGTIRLAAWLADADPELFREVLCHEVAHVVAYELHGRRCRPHGHEWQSLMRTAGFEPRVRFPESLLPASARKCRRPSALWDHECPACGAARTARRAMRSWRCARCHRAGRHGRLVVTKREGSGSGAR